MNKVLDIKEGILYSIPNYCIHPPKNNFEEIEIPNKTIQLQIKVLNKSRMKIEENSENIKISNYKKVKDLIVIMKNNLRIDKAIEIHLIYEGMKMLENKRLFNYNFYNNNIIFITNNNN
jgi:hypothetical protein